MTAVTKTIYTRPQNRISAQQICDNANTIFSAISESGMIQVPHGDYSGQCDSLVVSATANAKDIVVPEPTTSSETLINGYKVFRHPNKNYYVRVEIGSEGDGAGRRLCVRTYLAHSLNGTGGFSGTTANVSVKTNNYAYATNYLPNGTYNKALTLKVSTGTDHFVMVASFDFYAYTTNSASYFNGYTGISTIALAVIGSKINPRYSVVFYPRTGGWNSSYFEEYTNSSLTESDCQLQRKWLIDHQTNSLSYLGAGQSVNMMTETGTVSDINGVRVTQAYFTVEGEIVPLSMGCVHAGAVTDMGAVTIDIDGNGERNYFSSYGMGPCNWVPYNQPLIRIPVLLLPYY